MKGKYRVVVQNNRLHYEFEIRRNITIIQGDSATGKTTFIDMLRQYFNLGESSGIDVVCDVPCRVLEGRDWKTILKGLQGNILFIDEENSFINTEEFAATVKGSDNYFVLITRENLYNLPYSVEEIYGLRSSGKYQNTRKVYQQMYQIYSRVQQFPVKPKKLLLEDSNSGYEFFKAVSEAAGRECQSAGGKSNLLKALKDTEPEEICVIADGAAIGPEMNGLYQKIQKNPNIKLYLPESFEWIILNARILEGKEIQEILQNPEVYIDSKEYFSWERYFTKLLIEKTEGTYLQYKKATLNETYLHEKNKRKILQSMKGIDFK